MCTIAKKLLILLISGTLAIAIGIAKRVSELLLRGLPKLLLLLLIMIPLLPMSATDPQEPF